MQQIEEEKRCDHGLRVTPSLTRSLREQMDSDASESTTRIASRAKKCRGFKERVTIKEFQAWLHEFNKNQAKVKVIEPLKARLISGLSTQKLVYLENLPSTYWY
jgi:hypothetical protein